MLCLNAATFEQSTETTTTTTNQQQQEETSKQKQKKYNHAESSLTGNVYTCMWYLYTHYINKKHTRKQKFVV